MESNSATSAAGGRVIKRKWIWIAALAAVVVWVFASYQTLVGAEEDLDAQGKVVLTKIDGLVKKLETSGMITADYKDAVTTALKNYVEGRGKNGGTLFSAVSEAVPVGMISDKLWDKFMVTAIAEYTALEKTQNMKVAMFASFKKKIRNPLYFPAKWIGGFPTIDMSKAGDVIIGGTARDADATRQFETVDPFKKSGATPEKEKKPDGK